MSRHTECVSRNRAFTLIEVLAALLILSLGMLSAIGLVVYGMQLSAVAIGKTTGLATAMTVAIDPTPLLPADAFWTPAGGGVGLSKGYVNGFWVERTEDAGQVIATGIRASQVHVDVFETRRGTPICSYSERIVRQAP